MGFESMRGKSARFGVRTLLSVIALVPVLGRGADTDTSWLDIESRIQYGYYTEDPHTLRNLADPLAANPAHDRLKSYYQGLLEYRLTLLWQANTDKAPGAADASGGKPPVPASRNDRTKNEPRQRVERCVAYLDQALEAQSNFADALALQSACLRMLAELSTWRAPLATPKSVSDIHKALQLAPKNPRVLLLDAIGDYEHSKTPDASAEHACGKFKAATVMFEEERAAVDRVPGWGAAEAYTWLGRCYLDTGDAVKARDALERALLIAPEFAQARRLLAAITSG